MKVLLTGVTGYIGRRLLPLLIERGDQVVCLVRNPSKFHQVLPYYSNKVEIIACDLTLTSPLLPLDIQVAYYLIHSMSDTNKHLEEVESKTVKNFLSSIEKTQAKQIVYLSGLIGNKNLSDHLQSRLTVERLLSFSKVPLTSLRAGVIIGSASASFEMIRDLIEKLYILPVPKEITNLCQPISLDDTLFYLIYVLLRESTYKKKYDIGGPDVLSYLEMLKVYAELRGLKRYFIKVPYLPRWMLSFMLYFITSTNLKLAQSLVESLKNTAVCSSSQFLHTSHHCISYRKSILKALSPIAQTSFFSTVEEAVSICEEKQHLQTLLKIPIKGCYKTLAKQKNLTEDLKKHLKSDWILLKESPQKVILYKNKKKEYWIEYDIPTSSKYLWHRPKGIKERLQWGLQRLLLKKRL